MYANELAGLMDSTNLKPDATKNDIERLAEEAGAYGFASVCVPPCHVEAASRFLRGCGVMVSTVAGFPLGYQARGIKLAEAIGAFGGGAAEIDMVMNVSLFKSGEREAVASEIRSIVEALPDAVIKVIIEAGLLTDAEKADACEMVASSGAHFVKTSTGFGPTGATAGDVRLLYGTARGRVKVKAAGGIKDLDGALAMVSAGARRLGTSSAARIMEEFRKRECSGY